jgi:hypothetical protein
MARKRKYDDPAIADIRQMRDDGVPWWAIAHVYETSETTVHEALPEYREKKNARRRTPEHREKRNAQDRNRTPEQREKSNARRRTPEHREKRNARLLYRYDNDHVWRLTKRMRENRQQRAKTLAAMKERLLDEQLDGEDAAIVAAVFGRTVKEKQEG